MKINNNIIIIIIVKDTVDDNEKSELCAVVCIEREQSVLNFGYLWSMRLTHNAGGWGKMTKSAAAECTGGEGG